MVRGGKSPQTLSSLSQKNLRLRGCWGIYFFFPSLVFSVVVADALSSGQVNDKAIRLERHQKWPGQIYRSLDLLTQRGSGNSHCCLWQETTSCLDSAHISCEQRYLSDSSYPQLLLWTFLKARCSPILTIKEDISFLLIPLLPN